MCAGDGGGGGAHHQRHGGAVRVAVCVAVCVAVRVAVCVTLYVAVRVAHHYLGQRLRRMTVTHRRCATHMRMLMQTLQHTL